MVTKTQTKKKRTYKGKPKPPKQTKGAITTPINGGIREYPYTNSRGIKVVLRGIPPLKQDKVIQSMSSDPDWGPPPPKPQYEITLAGDAVVYKDHNLTTLSTPEEKAEWARWEFDTEAWNSELSHRLLHSFLWDGITMPVPSYWLDENEARFPHEDALDREADIYWMYIEEVVISKSARWYRHDTRVLKIKVPDEIEDRLMYYFQTQVLADQEDATAVGTIIRSLTGIEMESMEAAQNMFPDEVEEGAA